MTDDQKDFKAWLSAWSSRNKMVATPAITWLACAAGKNKRIAELEAKVRAQALDYLALDQQATEALDRIAKLEAEQQLRLSVVDEIYRRAEAAEASFATLRKACDWVPLVVQLERNASAGDSVDVNVSRLRDIDAALSSTGGK